jgi:hypothetical protein
MVFLKVTISARDEYRRGELALENKDITQAIIHFDRAIHWYAPGSKAVKNSIQALWDIGIENEEKNEYGVALQAFRALRSSLYSVRSFYTPHVAWIDRCDEKIASLIAREQAAGSSDGGVSSRASEEEIRKILKIQTAPNVFWTVLLEIGFLGWLGCSVIFILRVFAGSRGLHVRQALVWGVLVILFYALWIVGMLRA